MTNADLFLEKYKELENLAVTVYNLPEDGTAISRLSRMNALRPWQDKLRYCKEVRNLLVHRAKVKDDFAVEPSDAMVEMLDELLTTLQKPLRCRDIAIAYGSIFWRSMDDAIFPTIKEMGRRGYSHVPILRDRQVVGVFSESTLFYYVYTDGEVSFSRGQTFASLAPHLKLGGNGSRAFRFLPADALVDEAEELFEAARKKHERIVMIFLTQDGLPHQPLQGILTPWDILGHS